jgi:hypothetical protein
MQKRIIDDINGRFFNKFFLVVEVMSCSISSSGSEKCGIEDSLA